MPEHEDPVSARDAWFASPDGLTGQAYAEALEDAGQVEDALVVCATMWDDGFIAGATTAGVIEWSRGNIDAAIGHLADAAEVEFDPAHRPDIVGRLGHLRWHHRNDFDAETMLREGMNAYDSARADLADLLIATDRVEEARQVLTKGVAAGEVTSMLPLGNLLSEEGDTEAAADLYRRGYKLGDAHSAWNLAIQLDEEGEQDQAEEWRRRAADGGDVLALNYYEQRDNNHESDREE